MDQFYQALAHLLPPGLAWPRHALSTLMRTIRAYAGQLDALNAASEAAVADWQPITTENRLAEWEEATGLPDPCFGDDQAVEDRKRALLSRLRGTVLPLADSSPAAPAVLEALCLRLGYVATVAYNTPFRCGRHQVGRALGRLDGELYITIQLPAGRFRVGQCHVGQRLLFGDLVAHELRCVLARTVPARFHLNFILV